MIFNFVKCFTIFFFTFFYAPYGFANKTFSFYDPLIPEDFHINIQGKSLKKYATYLTNISVDRTGLIHQDYKSSFKIFLTHHNVKNQKVVLNGKARITGDYDDHINIRDAVSSLIIRLKKGNIGGITKFRLLLPVTRNGYNEIFWSVLMEYMGFPVPYRKMVNVYFNNNKKKTRMIFSERAEKEYIERFGLREAPIIEVDDRQEFANRFWRKNSQRCLGEFVPEKNKCKLNDAPPYLPYKIENQNFLKNNTSIEVFYRGVISMLESGKPNDLNSYFKELNRKYANHGIVRINEKYIYDPIFHNKIPIYVDGMVRIPKCKKKIEFKKLSIAAKKYFKIIQKLFSSRSLGKIMTDDMQCVALEIFKIKKKLPLVDLKKINNDVNYDLTQNLHENNFKPIFRRHNVTVPIVRIANDFKNGIYCNSLDHSLHNNCSQLLLPEIISALGGNFKSRKYKGYELYPIISIKKPNLHEEEIEEFNFKNSGKEIHVKNNQTKFLKLNSFNSILNVFLSPKNSRVVIYNSVIKNSKINIFKSPKSLKNQNNVRYNYRLLTGCLTIISSYIEKSKLSSENSDCEDSINMIRVNAKEIGVSITNSISDAIDVDFSNITFSQLNIRNSGNDCIDFSSSIFNILEINAIGCGDKALSVGERSLGVVKKIYFENSKIGFAVKDGSELNLLQLDSHNTNQQICGSLYNKKQEFGGGILKIPKLPLCSIEIDKHSFIKNNEDLICKYVKKNQFYTTCLTKNKIIFTKREFFPRDAVFEISSKNKGSNGSNFLTASLAKVICDHKLNICKINIKKNMIKKNLKIVEIALLDKNNKQIIYNKNKISIMD